ncbi:carboxyl transferase domain-containing protein [Pandoraea sp.]|uniref:acyl-CoA carboxylase subunit beta n=1 Tax=Pandoraea sp. TaxID=1883445 RepID=UPI00121D5D48|nr:carboxyl transferase domain-containing protein [Pandoraea sp.]TAL57069.1 MAG: propionyl-CoA carboxylase [Pandoraea sp.]TAM18111.1 MAG: propionyl-CoA carboxylase [Pandoraea sp.]
MSDTWQAEVDEIELRRNWARELGGAEAVAKHHAQGRLTIRERIGHLLDTHSFREVGMLAGNGSYVDGQVRHVSPAPYVCGLGRVDNRTVAVGGEDFTVRGGTSWGGDRRKGGQGGFVEDLAFQYRIPLINLIDGAGGTVTSAKRRGHTVFPGVHGFERSVQLLGTVPVISAVMGTAAGGPAGRAILSHWSIMIKDSSQIFAAGPPVVERSLGQKVTKEELGGAHMAVDVAGTVDNVAQSEEECFEMIRRFLSYLPQNVYELPPVIPCDDPVERAEERLLSIVPRDRRRPYNMRHLIEMVVDKGSIFEIQPTFGKALITSFARLNGKSVGIIANNPMIAGGAMDVKAARKQIHFIELCDTFHIPLVFLVDVPGFMVGMQAEAAATLREGMRAVYVGLQATVPILTVVIRKCYGMAGMGTTDKNGLDMKVAWPSAEWGSLPVEGGVAAAFKREIQSAANPAARQRELEEELRALASPFRTAEAFGVEDIIDPRETRAHLCRFIDAAQGRLKTDVGPKLKAGVRP